MSNSNWLEKVLRSALGNEDHNERRRREKVRIGSVAVRCVYKGRSSALATSGRSHLRYKKEAGEWFRKG